MVTRQNTNRGFTFIELLVAISVMAMMSLLSWRGLDGMTRVQARTQQHVNEVLTLQTGLTQWMADLDALVQMPQVNALDWDGRVLRMTRRGTTAEGWVVAAWSSRDVDGIVQWVRWQSPVLRNRGEVQNAWDQAAAWARTPGDTEKKREVTVTPLEQWRLYYFRGNAWSHPLSADAEIAPAIPGVVPPPRASSIPEGVRLMLTLPAGRAISGTITRDWVRSTMGGGKS